MVSVEEHVVVEVVGVEEESHATAPLLPLLAPQGLRVIPVPTECGFAGQPFPPAAAVACAQTILQQ